MGAAVAAPSTARTAGVARPPASAPGGLLEEAGPLHDDPGDLPRRDEPTGVGDGHSEGQPPALHGLEHRLRLHMASDRGRREVVELHAVADGRGAVLETVTDGEDGGRLGQTDDAPGRQDGHAAALDRGRGVVLRDDHLDDSHESWLQRHRRRVAVATRPTASAAAALPTVAAEPELATAPMNTDREPR